MAIANANAVYSVGASGQSTGPAFTGQIMVQNLGDPEARYFKGTATATGDGASSSFIVNWIDGTQTLPYVPSGILCVRSGGAATSTISVVSAGTITNTGFTVTTSAAVNAATFQVSFMAWK